MFLASQLHPLVSNFSLTTQHNALPHLQRRDSNSHMPSSLPQEEQKARKPNTGPNRATLRLLRHRRRHQRLLRWQLLRQRQPRQRLQSHPPRRRAHRRRQKNQTF